jgi:hypothetical protein
MELPMRKFRLLCSTTSSILGLLLIAFFLHSPVLSLVHFGLFSGALATGNAWAWSYVDGRSQRRCQRLNRRISTVLAAHDLQQIDAAITQYRNAEKKGSND